MDDQPPQIRNKCCPARSPEDKAERIAFATKVLCDFPTYHQQVREIMAKYGVQWRAAQRYMAEARKVIQRTLKKDLSQHIADQYVFLRSIMNDPLRSGNQRLKAQRQLSLMLGTNAPLQTQRMTLRASGTVEQIIRSLKNQQVNQIEAEGKDWIPPVVITEQVPIPVGNPAQVDAPTPPQEVPIPVPIREVPAQEQAQALVEGGQPASVIDERQIEQEALAWELPVDG